MANIKVITRQTDSCRHFLSLRPTPQKGIELLCQENENCPKS